MKRQLATLVSVCVVMALALLTCGPSTTGAAQQAKAKAKAKTKSKNAVDGALYSFVATNRSGKQIRFRYRAADLVLYDTNTNDVIGKSEPIAENRSRVTFNDKSKFPSEFMIHKQEGSSPIWTGKADFDKQSWTIDLQGIKR